MYYSFKYYYLFIGKENGAQEGLSNLPKITKQKQ